MSKLSGIGGRLYRGETSFDFIGKRRRWYAFSGVLIVASALALSIQGLHLGIEFKGGSEFTISKAGISIVDARSAVASTHVPGDTIIQKLGINKIRVQTAPLSTAQSNQVQEVRRIGIAFQDLLNIFRLRLAKLQKFLGSLLAKRHHQHRE